MSFSPSIEQLTQALRHLPGVGPKTAQRMTFHLLERDRKKGLILANAIKEALEKVGHCKRCRTFSETEVCNICANDKRNNELLCIVETPADILAIEQASIYRGFYFVLMGHLSPIDGIGPSDIGLDILKTRLEADDIKEIILATNHTVEGEATAYYISEMAKPFHIKMTRIAHGVPLGGELEYVDSRTLAEAITNRKSIEN